MGLWWRRERERTRKTSEEITAKNFPNMGKEIANHVQELERVPGRINPKRNTPGHIVIKVSKIKDKDKLLKATWEKWQIPYKGKPIRLSADFSMETLQARREWHDIFQVMKGKKLQPNYSTQQDSHSVLMAESKGFQSSKRKISITKPVLQQMLKELLYSGNTRKRSTKNKPKTINKIIIGSYVWIIILNVNGLMHQLKDTDWLSGYKNKTHICVVY